MMESMAKTRTDCNSNELEPTLNDFKAYVERAARQGVAVHEVEAGIWHRVLHLGHQALRLLFSLIGPGDMGETACCQMVKKSAVSRGLILGCISRSLVAFRWSGWSIARAK